MNKLQATKYLVNKGPGAKVQDYKGQIWTLREYGGVDGESHNDYSGLPTYLAPFSIIEPEKSNDELAREAATVWQCPGAMDVINTFKFFFDVMDQKIRANK